MITTLPTLVKNCFKSLLPSIVLLAGFVASAQYQPVLIAPMGNGGGASSGAILQYNLLTKALTKKVTLGQAPISGRLPAGSFTLASNGKYYGVTSSSTGSYPNPGELYEYDASTGTYTTLASFVDIGTSLFGTTGGGDPIQADNGKLYGLISSGLATSADGILYSYDINTAPLPTTVTIVHTFTSSTSGSYPIGALVKHSATRLFGTASSGGANGDGTLYEVNPTTSSFTKLVDFDAATSGSFPQGNLILGANGNYYGTTSAGGSTSDGNIYMFNPTNNTVTSLASFGETTTGKSPIGGLVLANDGMMYGVTRDGGANGLGTLYQFNPTNNSLTKKQDFAETTIGISPLGTLMQASDGKLYGSTMKKDAGSNLTSNNSILFSYEIGTNTLTLEVELNEVNHGQAWGNHNRFSETVVPCETSFNSTVSVTSSPTIEVAETGATYQWVNCSGYVPEAGETNQNFTPTQNGDYAVIITKAGCIDTSDCSTVTLTDLLNSSEETALVEVAPNPNSGSFTLSLSKAFKGTLEYDIVNSLGAVIRIGKINAGASQELTLDVKPGVYLVRTNDTHKPLRFEVY